MDGNKVLPVCGLTESGARSLIRPGIRAGVAQREVLEPAVRFEAYELAAILVEEYARVKADLTGPSPEPVE